MDKVRKANENLAFGEEHKKDALPFGGTLQVMGNQAAKLGNVTMMPRRGHDIVLDREAGPIMLPIADLFKRLRGHMTPALNRELRASYGDSIEAANLERLADEIIATGIFSTDEADTKVRQAL